MRARSLQCAGLLLLGSALNALPAMAQDTARVLLWGDTHLHTDYSTDSYLNQNFTFGPAEAYRFAKGGAITHPLTGESVSLDTPLDFLVVSDHAESFGTMKRANEQGLPREGLGPGDWLQSFVTEKLFRFLASRPGSITKLLDYASADTLDPVEAAKTPATIRMPNDEQIMADAWQTSIRETDAANEPGRFTALIGWEWSSIPAGSNLHRVVVTDSNAEVASRYLPFSSSTSSYPEDLWQWLDETSATTGADFVAIPHNSNISRGFMFPRERRLRDTPIDRDWIDARARWETVVEATQVKGDSETDPAVSPDDPFADFETYPHYISPTPIPFAPGPGDFVRSALRTGLELEAELGANPYRLGMIGSTDSHTGLATAEEPNFWGKFLTDSTPDRRAASQSSIERFGWVVSAQGLAAVWAEDNTRPAILRALKRREVYATTGPRIHLRFFAGSDYESGDATSTDFSDLRRRGVPMGGMLERLEVPPRFVIQAVRDPRSGSLDRIQIVKGWLEGAESRERVYDVVASGGRARQPDGRFAEVPDTVDPATGRFTDEHGSASLAAVWTDPDFDASQPAFYYVRVLEIPTPRHSTLDAIELGIDPAETGQALSIQERAYSSPIHYRP